MGTALKCALSALPRAAHLRAPAIGLRGGYCVQAVLKSRNAFLTEIISRVSELGENYGVMIRAEVYRFSFPLLLLRPWDPIVLNVLSFLWVAEWQKVGILLSGLSLIYSSLL